MPEEVTMVVGSEMIDVLAPPAEIRVSVGVGSRGQRGSRIWAGSPNPAVFFTSLGETPMVGDMYISVPQQRAYQFVSSPSGNVWVTLFDMADLVPGSTEPGTFIPDPSNPGLYILTG